jgi:hypothetical protein
MEVVLYHKLSGSLNRDSENWTPGGTAISIMFQKGIDYGPQNNFFNSFIHQIPIDKENVAKQFDIKVGDEWGPEMIIPQIKTYYYYQGSLPFPPAEEGWKWIVFEEIQQISGNIVEALKVAFNNNTRPIQPLNGRVAAYNANVDFDFDKALERKSSEAEANKKANEKANAAHGTTSNDDDTVSSADRMKVVNMEKARTAEWYKSRKMYIKGLLICGVFLLIIYAALRFVKYIIKHDVLNKIMVEQALKAKFKEQEFKSKSKNSNSGPKPPSGTNPSPAGANKPLAATPPAATPPANNSSMNNSSSNNSSSNNSSSGK